MSKLLPRTIRKFVKQQDGALTAFGLFFGLSSIVIGGLAIDVASAMMARTQLQAAADSAAHAALYMREWEDAATAKTAALAVAEVNMPSARFGSLLTADDIKFGYWDRDAQAFQIDPSSKEGVYVNISRLASKGNSVGTYFLRFAGFGSWDVRRGSVFETYIPKCFLEGMVADNLIDMQSNNTFKEGFCIHSNTHVELNNGNVFEPNTYVSMPDKRNVVTPGGDLSTSAGLADALHDNSYKLRVLNRLETIMSDLFSGGADYAPDYITSSSVVSVSTRSITPADLSANHINEISCYGSQRLRLLANNTFKNVVIVTNCVVDFGAQVTLKNMVIATTNTNADSFKSAAQLQVGRDDNCAPGGGTQLLTMGGINFPAYLNIYGGQLIAMKNIEFSANANGIQGASMVAGGTISGTSNMVMGFCDGDGMEGSFQVEYFRLAS